MFFPPGLASYGSSLLETQSKEAVISLDAASGYDREGAHSLIESVTSMQTKMDADSGSSTGRLGKMEIRLEESFEQLNQSLDQTRLERSGMRDKVEARMEEIRGSVAQQLEVEKASRMATEERLMSVLENFMGIQARIEQ